MEFSEALKSLRKEAGLSQEELADKIFVSRSAIARWENGIGIPSEANLTEICKFFDVTPTELGFEEKKKQKGGNSWIFAAISMAVILMALAFSLTVFLVCENKVSAERKNEELEAENMEKAFSSYCCIGDVGMDYLGMDTVKEQSVSFAYSLNPSELGECPVTKKAESYEMSFSSEPDSVEAYCCGVDEDYNPVKVSYSSKKEWYGSYNPYQKLSVLDNVVSFDFDTPMAALLIRVCYGDIRVYFVIVVK